MGYTYPAPAPTLSGDTLSISRFLQSPNLIARRLRTILEQRFIADAVLSQRLTVSGGAILYETGETIYTADDPRAVAPGSEYPTTSVGTGTASLAKTVKWGQDAIVTDEAIARQRLQPVDRAFTKLGNQIVKYVDGVAMAAVGSAVTATTAAPATAANMTAQQWITTVLLAKQAIVALDQGYDPDSVVLNDTQWGYAMAALISAGLTPRESADTALLNGQFPEILGMRWMATNHVVAANTALVADSKMLGGMADEELGGPGYAKVDGVGVEVKTIRDDENDRFRLRGRRVTVPVVLEPAAGNKVTGL